MRGRCLEVRAGRGGVHVQIRKEGRQQVPTQTPQQLCSPQATSRDTWGPPTGQQPCSHTARRAQRDGP